MARRSMIVASALAAAVSASMLVPGVGLAPAEAAARVTVENANGEAVADPTYGTNVTVSGRGFQSVKGGFGGVYVVFGTVKGTWKPSKGGKTGQDYFYVPDSEEKDNQGFVRFVSYPGSDTSEAANGGVVKANGTWKTSMTIPGATFQALDRNGKAATIDCRKVTCGVITFGAHGVANGANESFTPIRFKSLTGAKPAPSASASASTPATTAPIAVPDAAPKPTAPVGPASVTVDRATAVVGRVLTFTATGFRPGEQVVASFDDGRAAVGPLGAGESGEVAGVLQLPADVTAGTHVLKLTGAASGATPTASFAVADPAAVAPAEESENRAGYIFMGVALLVLAASVALVALRSRISRRTRPARGVISDAT